MPFRIAISVLQDAQRVILEQTGQRRRIRCFFSESDPEAYGRLRTAVEAFHDPGGRFEIRTHSGRFEDAVPDIQRFVGTSFALVFIDPTGWTGYPLDRIRPLFAPQRCEVLVNFMYDHINRFVSSEEPEIVASFDAILGGPGWRNRLDPTMPRGPAVERLFRATLRDTCGFEFVVSTRIDKPTVDRPHFFIAYGTKNQAGLKAFRDVEYRDLRQHEQDRRSAKDRREEDRTGQTSLFPGLAGRGGEATLDDLVGEQVALAKTRLLGILTGGPLPFSSLVPRLLQPFMIREKNVKDICVALARDGLIANTWGTGNRKPNEQTVVGLSAAWMPAQTTAAPSQPRA